MRLRRSLLAIVALCACGDDAEDPPIDAGAPDAGACVSRWGAGDHDLTVVHDGVEHIFHVHVPAGVTEPAPVVLFFHGGGGSAEGQEIIVQLLPVADREGFVLVRGEGTETVGGPTSRVWNAGACCGVAADTATSVDHVGAVEAFLDELETRLCIDSRRIYATGHSNGGMLAYRLACELAERIAAVAPNAAFLMDRNLNVSPPDVLFACTPSRPVPILQLHGLADLCAPYEGGTSNGLDPSVRPSVAHGIDVMREINGCASTSSETFANGMASCQTWDGCEADVTLCTVAGAGHTWPGSPIYRPATQAMCGGTGTEDLDANAMIWEFFRTHPRP